MQQGKLAAAGEQSQTVEMPLDRQALNALRRKRPKHRNLVTKFQAASGAVLFLDFIRGTLRVSGTTASIEAVGL